MTSRGHSAVGGLAPTHKKRSKSFSVLCTPSPGLWSQIVYGLVCSPLGQCDDDDDDDRDDQHDEDEQQELVHVGYAIQE